jgi:hypothetical protein
VTVIRYLIFVGLVFAGALSVAATDQNAGRYLEVDEYLASAFAAGQPQPGTLWVGGDLRAAVEKTLGHRFAALRVRYWFDGDTSVWVLDEIGKELPITIGVTVRDDRIVNVRVLEFRESRGWEVRYPFFTDQFNNVTLSADGRLSRKIDGITGATLSVGAVKRIARVALVLHDNVKSKG